MASSVHCTRNRRSCSMSSIVFSSPFCEGSAGRFFCFLSDDFWLSEVFLVLMVSSGPFFLRFLRFFAFLDGFGWSRRLARQGVSRCPDGINLRLQAAGASYLTVAFVRFLKLT